MCGLSCSFEDQNLVFEKDRLKRCLGVFMYKTVYRPACKECGFHPWSYWTAPNLIHWPLCLWQKINVQMANRDRESLSSNANEPFNRNRWCHWTVFSVAACESLTFSSSVIIFHRSSARYSIENAFMLTPQHWTGSECWYVILRSSGLMCRKDVNKNIDVVCLLAGPHMINRSEL